MRILGIDPGSRITGYGIIETHGDQTRYLTSGAIALKEDNLSFRLSDIFNTISDLIQTHLPTQAAIEEVFMHANAQSALKLGHARGAALVAIAQALIPVESYSAKQVKKSVIGYGGAEKSQIQRMVQTLLNLPELPGADEADALAIALCHAQMYPVMQRLGGAHSLKGRRVR